MSEYRLARIYSMLFRVMSELLSRTCACQGFLSFDGPFCEGFRRGLVFRILVFTIDALCCFAELLLYFFWDVDLDLGQLARVTPLMEYLSLVGFKQNVLWNVPAFQPSGWYKDGVCTRHNLAWKEN